MSKIVFIPLTDEMVFERPDMIVGPITTYQPTDSEKLNRSVSAKGPPFCSGAYLTGDLVNGLDVIYVKDNLTKLSKPKKYRVLKRST